MLSPSCGFTFLPFSVVQGVLVDQVQFPAFILIDRSRLEAWDQHEVFELKQATEINSLLMWARNRKVHSWHVPCVPREAGCALGSLLSLVESLLHSRSGATLTFLVLDALRRHGGFLTAARWPPSGIAPRHS